MAGNVPLTLTFTRTQRYGLAAIGVILTALMRAALDPMLGPNLPLFLFVIPILVSGWYGGLWPGMLATGLSMVAGDYLFIPPRGTVFEYADLLDVHRLLALAAIGTFFSVLCEKTREEIKSRFESIEGNQ